MEGWSKIVQSLLTFLLCTSTDCAAVQTFGLCKSTDNGCGYFLGCIWTQIVQLRNSIPTFQKLRSFVAYLNLVGFTHFLCYFFQSKSANVYTFCISMYCCKTYILQNFAPPLFWIFVSIQSLWADTLLKTEGKPSCNVYIYFTQFTNNDPLLWYSPHRSCPQHPSC